MLKKTYKKIVQIPTGVVTRINDTLQGKIEVEFEVKEPFNKELCK